MKKYLLIIISILSVFILTSCNKTAANEFNFIIDESYHEYIILGTSADYPPYESIAKVNGKETVVGIDIELAKEIAKKAKKNLKVINRGFDFLIEDLNNGKVDFVISGMNPTPEREEVVDFSKIYYEASHAVLVHKNNETKYDELEKLNTNIVIGAQLGSIQQDLVKENFPKATTRFLQDIRDLVMQLNDQQIDALVLEKPVAQSFVNNFNALVIKDFKIGNPEDGSAVAVKKNNNELLTLINQTIDELILSGKMDEIITNSYINEAPKKGFSFLLDKYYVTTLLKGLLMTLILALLSVGFGSFLAFFVSMMRLSNNKIIEKIAKIYVEIIRGTPLLVQVLLIYSLIKIPSKVIIGIDISTFIPGMLALLINSSAYVSEIIRGGILSIDKGQTEAALSLGMNNKLVMRKIVFPQALKNIIPSLGNEFVTMIKETSIFMYLGVAELMYSSQIVKTGTYAIKEVYITVAILYLVLTLSTSKLMGKLEKRLAKNEK